MDKTAEIDRLCPRALNRLDGVVSDVGGKGINVSKTIAALGRQSVACGFLAGQTGQSIRQTLLDWPGGGIRPDFLTVPGETRTNLKLVEPGGELTELNERGPHISQESLDALTAKLEGYAAPGTLFVLAGSVGPGVPPGILPGPDSASETKRSQGLCGCRWSAVCPCAGSRALTSSSPMPLN